MSIKDSWIKFIYQLQDDICTALEASDGKAKFIEDAWQWSEGAGGKIRVISNGNVLETLGVNTSIVFGDITDLMREQLKMK